MNKEPIIKPIKTSRSENNSVTNNSLIKPTITSDSNAKESLTTLGIDDYGSYTNFGESKYDNKNLNEDIISGSNLNEYRAQEQSSLAKLGNGITKGIIGLPLGVLQGASVLLDPDFYAKVATGNFKEYENSISESILNAKNSINSNLPVYRTKSSEGFSPMSAGWYADILPSAIEAASLMIPGYAITKGLSLLGKATGGVRLLKTVGTLMGVEGKALSQGLSLVSTASLSRMNEQFLQATDAAKNWKLDNQDRINPNTNEKYTDEELNQMSGEIANQTFYSGLPLVALDLIELNTIFKGFKGFQAARKANLDKSVGSVAKKVALGEVLPESFDEAVQFIQQKEAEYEQDVKTKKVPSSTFNERLGNYLKDEELWTAAFAGGFGGALMYAGGRILARKEDKIKDRTQNQAEDIARINDAVVKGDKQAFHKESDIAFAKAVIQHIQDNTIDDFKDNLSKLSKTENEFLEGDDFNDKDFYKRLKNRIEALDIIDKSFYDIQNDTEVPTELKSVKLATIIDQRLTQSRINYNTTDLQVLINEDIQNGFSINHIELKKAQGEYFAIITNPRSTDKQKEEAGTKLNLAYNNAIIIDPRFENMSIEEAKDALSKDLITSNDNQINNIIANIHDDNLDINESKEKLAEIAKDPKKLIDEIKIKAKEKQDAIDKENARIAKETKPETIAKTIIDGKELTPEQREAIESQQDVIDQEIETQLDNQDKQDLNKEYYNTQKAEIEARRQEELNVWKQMLENSENLTVEEKEKLLNSIDETNTRFNKELADLDIEIKAREAEVKKSEEIKEVTNDGIVPDLSKKDRNKIEQELEESLEFESEEGIKYSPQGKSVTLGDLIVPAANAIAYLSRAYNQFIATKAGKTYRKKEDIDESLNAQMQEPLLLSPNHYQVGEELFIEVDTAFNLVLDDNNTITYSTYKDDNLRVPMKIVNKNGKIIGYLHTIDWVNENNVASKNNNIELQREILTSLRYDIFTNGRKKVNINSKSFGKLSKTLNNESKPTSETITNPNPTFVVARNNQLLTGVDEIMTGNVPVNKSYINGLVYMVSNTPVKGKTVALPLFNTKVTEQTVDTLANAVEAFLTQDEKLADEILKHTDIDILSISGLKDFFNLFIATNSFDKADVALADGRDDKLFIDVFGSGIKFALGGGHIVEVGNSEHWNRDEFNFVIREAYNSVFLRHMNKPSFKYVNINNDKTITPVETTYSQYIKEITTSNVIDHELPDGTYTSFIQPVITFASEVVNPIVSDTSNEIRANKVISTKPTEEESSSEEISTEEPTELGQIDWNVDIDSNEDLSPVTFDSKVLLENSTLIPGFTAYKQAQVLATINSYVLRKLKEGGDKGNLDVIYEDLKKIFNQYSKFAKVKNPKLANEFDKIVNNFDTFRVQSQEQLERFNIVQSDVKGEVNIDDLESAYEKTNFDDGATFQIDPKDGMSNRLKQFFSFIPSSKKSYLGMESYMSYDEVVNYLQGQLAGLDASYEDIGSKLDELVKSNIWVSTVKDLLDKSEDNVKNEFVVWATKHYTGFKIVRLKAGKNNVDVNIIDADQNSTVKVILAKWLNNLKSSQLVYEKAPGELAIDSKKRDSLIEELKNTPKTDLNAIREWLNKIGIDVSLEALEAIKSLKKVSFEEQFTNKDGIFKTIIENLTKANIDNEDSFESNNPMLSNSGIRKLAYFESRFTSAYFSNSHKNGEGKTIFSYSPNKFFVNQFYRIKHNKANFLTNLLSTSFASTSSWGKKLLNVNNYFTQVFDFFYVDSLKVGNQAVTLDKMSSREHEVSKLAYFHNQMNGSTEKKEYVSHFLFPTMSDKSTMTGITAIRHNTGIKFKDDGTYDINPDSITAVYQIVEAEYQRIRNSYNIKNDVEGYRPTRFYMFPEFNDLSELWEGEGNQQKLKPIDANIVLLLRSKLEEHIKQLVETKKADWTSLGILKDNKLKFVDSRYINHVRGTLRQAQITDSNIATYTAADYVTNYLIANSNMFQLFIGDPAQYWKKNMEETWINIGKRLASMIAPGLELADSKDNKYKQAFVKDAHGVLSISKNYAQIEKLIGKEAAKPYKHIEGTDAQEWTTLKEHLYILNKSGKITEAKVKELLEKEESGKLDKNDFKTIFQPIKPVYVNTQLDASMDMNRMIYIKSSSFPLIKGLTPEFDKLRKAMIEQGIDRIAFKSATKVGGPKTFDDIFDENGDIKSDVKFDNSIVLDRTGFRIQQEVPFDEDKDVVNRGTQESKLLFGNILGVKGFTLNDKETDGEDLYNQYNQLNKELFEGAKAELFKEILNPISGKPDLIKLQAKLIEEAKGRNWSKNDIDALTLIDLGKFENTFALPLWSSSAANKIEALLSSIVDNGIRKQKIRGNSFVLGSEEGFKGNFKDIIYTKEYNPETGLLPQRIGEDGKVLPAQILIGNKLRDSKGNLVDLTKLVDKNGLLDLTKVDEEVLKVFGFRIPTQGHNSMTYAKVVGFLPSYMGDLIITPKDFTKQMGSDFDVDKLYTYFYNTTFKEGILTKFVYDETKPSFKHKKKDIHNKLLDIHLSVMSNPKIIKQILQPLGFGQLKLEDGSGLAKDIDKARNERLKGEFKPTNLSDSYQRDKYMKARGGKSGTGVKSLDSVFTVISQNKGLYLRRFEKDEEIPIYIIFGNENGKEIALNNLSSDKTVDGTSKLETVAAYQSAAVDNEKEQILEKINSNNYTFDVERAMSGVGYTENYIAPFTSQDIVFEYVDQMSKMQDSLNEEFISKPEDKIVEELINKYAKEGGIAQAILESLKDENYPLTQKEMWDSIEKGKEDPNYYKTQIRVLSKFNYIRAIGKEISNVQLAINTDSAGVPSSLMESNYKETRVKNAIDNPMIANVQNLLTDTINGYATDNALKVNNELWSELFPYKSERFNQLFTEIIEVTGKQLLTTENRQKIFNDIRSFVYTKVLHTLDTSNIRDLRQQLFFNTKTNKSLALRIKELQASNNNPFVQRLIPEIDITGKTPSLVKYNAAAAENYDELSIQQGFVDLLINESTREIAQDLITYFYLSGGIQQAIQFGKYIPISYLTNIKFAEELRKVSFDDETTLGIIDFKMTGREVSTFTRQWLQHNPSQAIKLKEDLSQLKKTKTTNKSLDSFELDDNKAQDLVVLRMNPVSNALEPTYPEFLSLLDDSSPKYFSLYEYQGNGKYVKIDLLGSFGYSEYRHGQSNTSLIFDNQTKPVIPQITRTVTDNRDSIAKKAEVKIDNNVPKTSRVEQYSVDKGIKQSLQVISNSTNKLYSLLAKEFLKQDLSKVDMQVSTGSFKGSFKYKENGYGTISINPKNINSDEEFERTILHELIHHLTGHTIRSKNRTKEQDTIINSLTMLQSELIKKINSNPEWKAAYDEFVKKYEAKEHVDEMQVSKNYGAYKLTEFVTMAMTDLEFQKILNEIPFNSDKSMLDRFIDLVKKILDSVGFKVNENSVLSKGIEDIVNLINTKAVNEEGNLNISDLLPIGTDEQRVNVRSEIKQKILDSFGVGRTSATQISTNSILLPIGGVNGENQKLLTKENTYNWAKSIETELNKYFNTKTYGKVIAIDSNSNPKGTIVNILQPTALIDHLISENNEDQSPKTISKHQATIDKLKDRVSFLTRKIATIDRTDRELITKLRAKKKELEDRIVTLDEDGRLADIVAYGKSDLNEAKKLLTADKVSELDLLYTHRILKQWENASSYIFRNRDIEKIDGQYTPNVQAIKDIENEANDLNRIYNQVFENSVQELFKNQGVEATKEQIFSAKKEISALQANLMDSSRSSDLLSQVTSRLIREASLETEKELVKEYDLLDNLFSKVSKNDLFKRLGFKVFAQENKDANKTGNLVSRFSQGYYEEAKRLRKAAREGGKWSNYFDWKKDNTIVFDLRKIFYEEYKGTGGQQEYSQEAIKAHISDLKQQLGEKGYEQYSERLKEKFDLYKEDLKAYEEHLETLEGLDDATKALKLQEWTVTNSPFVYAESINEGTKFKIGNKFVHLKGYKYTEEVPRRFTKDGKATNWYDPKFEQIEANEDLYNFYRHVIEKYNELYSYMPEYMVDELQFNYLPEIRKNIIELFSDKGFKQGLAGWHDKIVAELTTDDLSNVSYTEIDPNTGKPIKSLPIGMIANKLNAEEKSYDILKVTKAFTAMALAYKHKSKIEDSVRLAEQAMTESLERQENAQGEQMIDKLGRPINTKDALKNLKAQFDYLIDAAFYGNRKKVEGVSKKKLYKKSKDINYKDPVINKEIKISESELKKKLQDRLKDPNLTTEDRAALLDELNSIGSNIVGSQTWDKILQFAQLKGMGWNLFAPSNNVVFGFVSNLIHASGGEDYTINEFFKAQGIMLNSVGKSVTLDVVKTKTANKINAFMKYFNVVGEIDQVAYQSTSMNSAAAKGLNKLAPLELTRRAEYLNQGTTAIALALGVKVDGKSLWEMYEEVNGELKLKEEFKDKVSPEIEKQFKFKLEQIKKSIHGNYDPNSPVLVKKTTLGRATIMFRSWVAEGFASRFEAEKHDILLGRSRKGRFRTWNPITGGEIGHLSGASMLLTQMANFLSFGTVFKTSLDQLSAVDKANMRKNAAEVLVYLSLYSLVLILKAFDSDDDDEKKAINALLNVGFRVQNDMAFFTSPLAFEKISQSTIPAMTIITDAAKLIKAMEDQIAGKGTYERGYFRGQSKVKIALMKQAPGLTQIPRTISGLAKANE